MNTLKMSNNGFYFLFMAVMYVISPFSSFIIALLNYKRGVSQFFFVAFAFYFGYQVGPNFDLFMHYDNYTKFQGHSLFDMYRDFWTIYLGQEPFHIIFKYILSLFGLEERGFSGCAAAVYATSFVCFMRQFKPFYLQKMNRIQLLIFIAIGIIVEFYWYFGLRFWTGVFIFMTFYIKYVITGKKVYLCFTPLCLLFHVALAILFVAIGVLEVTKNNRIFQLVFLAISFVYKYVDFGFIDKISTLPIVKSLYKSSIQNEDIRKAVAKRTQDIYSSGNFVYQSRVPILLFLFFIILFWLWSKNKQVLKSYSKTFGFVLLLFAFANFGHSNITFYERFFKLTALLAYCYLFLILFEEKNLWINNHMFLKLVILAVVSFIFLTALVQERQILMSPLIWLGDFFTESPMIFLENVQ